ncbi:MAG: metallophosphoesterase family protein [Bacteroidetes bacterium]|nr:metallophosphoesterase family protein [Bacteroidota bacterium]
MKRILILSDTHGYMDDAILRHAAQHDEIWHAGDWGTMSVLTQLEEVRPVQGVYGNIDGADLRLAVPETNTFTCESVRVYMRHITGYPGRYKSNALKDIAAYKPNLVVCGHSHILKVMYDPSLQHLHINPGAIGIHGFHHVRTMISLEIDGSDMRNLKVIEFEKR